MAESEDLEDYLNLFGQSPDTHILEQILANIKAGNNNEEIE